MKKYILKLENSDKKIIKKFIKNAKYNFPELKFIILKKKLNIYSDRILKKKEFNQIIDSIKIFQRLDEKIIFKKIKKIKYIKNPLKILKKKNEVIQIDKNLFQFQGEFLSIFRSLDSYFKNLALKRYNAIEQENPVLWPIDLFKKINYLSEFPQQVLMITSLKKNSKIYSKFSNKYKSNNQFKDIKISRDFENINYGLQPAVCDNCYYSIRNTKNNKNLTYTTMNKVFRNEFSFNKSLDRLMTFTVRDIMFIGDEDFIRKTRIKIISDIKKFFILSNLSFSIEIADDPFFSAKINKKLFQQSHELKYEILVYIPYLKKKIAVGSINNHLDTFGKSLSIKNKKGFVHSGCMGIGFERLVFALYCQLGTDLKKWPKSLKDLLNI